MTEIVSAEKAAVTPASLTLRLGYLGTSEDRWLNSLGRRVCWNMSDTALVKTLSSIPMLAGSWCSGHRYSGQGTENKSSHTGDCPAMVDRKPFVELAAKGPALSELAEKRTMVATASNSRGS
jgi:hypothetical protein